MSEFSLFFNLLLLISVIAFAFFGALSSAQLANHKQVTPYFSLYFLFNALGFLQFLIGQSSLLTATGNASFVLSVFALIHGLKKRTTEATALYRDPIALTNIIFVLVFTWVTLNLEAELRVFRVAVLALNLGILYLYGVYLLANEEHRLSNSRVMIISLFCCAGLMSLSWLPLYLTQDPVIHLRAIFIAITLSIFLVFGGVLMLLMTDLTELYYKSSITDSLSKLYNGRYLMAEGQKLLDKATDKNFSVCCVMFDIDHFKRINDDHGHDVGDESIKRFAELLSMDTRARDLVARIGGEEFVVLLNNASAQQSIDFAERIRCKVPSVEVNGLDTPFELTVSVGVVQFKNESLSDLLKKADAAMYSAKKQGRNRVVFNSEAVVTHI